MRLQGAGTRLLGSTSFWKDARCSLISLAPRNSKNRRSLQMLCPLSPNSQTLLLEKPGNAFNSDRSSDVAGLLLRHGQQLKRASPLRPGETAQASLRWITLHVPDILPKLNKQPRSMRHWQCHREETLEQAARGTRLTSTKLREYSLNLGLLINVILVTWTCSGQGRALRSAGGASGKRSLQEGETVPGSAGEGTEPCQHQGQRSAYEHLHRVTHFSRLQPDPESRHAPAGEIGREQAMREVSRHSGPRWNFSHRWYRRSCLSSPPRTALRDGGAPGEQCRSSSSSETQALIFDIRGWGIFL